MKNKMLLIAGAVTVATLATTSVFADFGRWMLPQLSTEEKTKIETMTQEERQTYFETKKAEMEARMDSHEAVIDKLLNGETLTADEKKLVEEIKAQRAEHKAKKAEMEAKRTQMDAIKTKLQNGETLTTEEQALVDEMKSMKKDKKGWHGGKWFGDKKGGGEKGWFGFGKMKSQNTQSGSTQE